MQDADDLLALAPLLPLVDPGVPDGDLAGTVLALRDGALERAVLQGVVLGHHGQAVGVRVQRWSLGHCPGDQHTGVLQAEVPVQPPGVMLLDDEGGQLPLGVFAGCGRIGGDGFGGLGRVAHGAVGGQAVQGLGGDGVRGVCVRVGVRIIVRRPAQRGDGVQSLGNPIEHLVQLQLGQIRVLQLLPGARGGHPGTGSAAQGVGADGGLGAVVLAPIQEHLAGAVGLLHAGDDQVRVVGLQGAGQFVCDLRDRLRVVLPVQGGVQVDALGAGGHREGLHAHPVQDLPAPPGHLGALGQAHTLPGVQVQHQPIRVAGLAVAAEPPLRGVQLQGRHLGEPGQHGRLLRQRVGVGALGVLDPPGGDPVRRRVLQVLAEEHLARVLLGPHAVHPPLPGDRPPRDLRDEHLGHRQVVVHDIGLGGPRLRVEHLVQAGHGQRPLPHLEPLPAGPVCTRHARNTSPARLRGQPRLRCASPHRPPQPLPPLAAGA